MESGMIFDMNKPPFDPSHNFEDELLPEYDFDYSKAKPNRFATGDRQSPQYLKGNEHRDHKQTNDQQSSQP
jgi:hypothetical protein